MSKYIDVDLLISELRALNEQERLEYMGIYDCIKSVPTADVQEIRHGKWIYDKDYDMFHCSECQCIAPSVNTFKEQFDYDWDENLISSGYEEYTSYIQTNYCPECGAKMDGKEDEE